MLINACTLPMVDCKARFLSWQDSDHFIVCRGLLYLDGLAAGEASIIRLAERLRAEPLSRICNDLRGVFGIMAYAKEERIWRATVDNAGNYHLFFQEEEGLISTSFLEMAAHLGCTSRQLGPEAVAEFLASGFVHWQRTFLKGIRKIRFDEIMELPLVREGRSGRCRIVHKEFAARPGANERDFIKHFEHLAAALRHEHVSVDITAGFDTRLIACLLSHFGLDYEAAIASRPDIPELRLSEEVARALGKELVVTFHDVNHVEEELPTLFRKVDGLSDMMAFHRLDQLNKDRKARGVTAMVHGASGALYKDFFWLQDFPFYGVRRADFGRLYDIRLAAETLPPTYLAGDTADAYRQLRARTIRAFETLRGRNNTESYDNVYFHYRNPELAGRSLTSHINNGLMVAAPLSDYHNVQIGYRLKRTARIANRFHRKLITAYGATVASLPTSSGRSAALGGDTGQATIDVLRYAGDVSARLVKKIGQRAFNRTWLQPAHPNHSDMVPRARQAAAFEQALADLKDLRVLKGGLRPEEVRDAHVGRLLTLGHLARHLGS